MAQPSPQATGCCSCIRKPRSSRAGKWKRNPSSPGEDGTPARRGVPFRAGGFRRRSRRAEAKAALRTTLFALPYGDQGLLIPKRLYQKLGGYRA
jgi:hypothetical protein